MNVTRLLNSAAMYTASQRLVGKAGLYQHLVQDIIKPERHMRILDIGCGTGELLRFLADVTYIGFDSNQRYIAAARHRFGARGAFRIADIQDADAPEALGVDVAVAVGVLHHLDDTTADALCRLARAALNPSGRLVTLDPAIVPGRSAIDRLMTALDRGAHVRTPAAYRAIIERHFAQATETIQSDLLWVTQTLVVFEASRGKPATPQLKSSND